MATSSLLTPDIDPQQESARRKVALALMMQGASAEPIRHWTQGLARLAQGAMGGYELGQEEAQKRAEEASVNATLQNAIRVASRGGYQADNTPEAPAPQPSRVVAALAGQPATRSDATGSMFGGMSGWAPDERPIEMGAAPAAPVQTAQAAPAQQPSLPGAVPSRGTPALSPQEAAGLSTLAADKRFRPQVINRLLEATKPKEQWREPTAAEQARGITAVNTVTGEPKTGPMSVNVSTEKKGAEALGTKSIEEYIAAQNVGRESTKRIALYDRMQQAMKGFTPGASAPLRLEALRWARELGLTDKDISEGEILKQISNQLAIHAQPKGQGAVSNFEREMFAKALPNMSQSPQGLAKAIDVSRRLEEYDRKASQIWREEAAKAKRTGAAVPDYLDVQNRIADELGDPLTDKEKSYVKEYMPNTGGVAPVPVESPKVRRYNPATGKIE